MGSVNYAQENGDGPVIARLRELGLPEKTMIKWANLWAPQFVVACMRADGKRHAVVMDREWEQYRLISDEDLVEAAAAMKEWLDGQGQAETEAAS